MAVATQPAIAPPPGWYPDQQTFGWVRWWDGAQWTAHAQPAQPQTGFGQVPPAWGYAGYPGYATVAEPTRGLDANFLVPVNRSALAIAAGYAGLFAITLVLAPIALVLGLLALQDLSRKPNLGGRGRAWFGVIAGALGSLVLIITVINAS